MPTPYSPRSACYLLLPSLSYNFFSLSLHLHAAPSPSPPPSSPLITHPHPYLSSPLLVPFLIPLTPSEAIVGGAIEVPTIDGLVKMNVPAGVKSGQRLKLANKGYPNIRGERGDQLVIVQIVIPTEVTEAEKKLYEQIQQIEQFKPRNKLINDFI